MSKDLGKSLEGDRTPGQNNAGGASNSMNVCPGSKGGSMGSRGGDIKQGKIPTGDAAKWRNTGNASDDGYLLGSKGYRPGLGGK